METNTVLSTGMGSRQRLELTALCSAIRWDVDMAAYSTFRTGGMVEALADINAIDELVWCCNTCIGKHSMVRRRRWFEHPGRQAVPSRSVHPIARSG
jgi:hypothetical protein